MNAPPPFGYYAPPASQSANPGVILLVRIYAAFLAVSYLGGTLFIAFTPAPRHAPQPLMWMNLLICTVCVLLGALHIVTACMPRKPWAWTVGVVTLAFGVMSCAIVFAIPLLVVWLRPQCRAAFMRA